ncbi:TetR/AcrR family transcriptional regulator [Actinophytocola algeriensis]|uniref:AcrR family transcriptional regulator n=1 Tax=Actinophytocola algeriensis TaxID=1768010 RepID=A0A7W7VJK9_9PSEU|nr:TetR family transcriptional regulator [Actinophytocola algeriensis]MBB4912449.1 AcrR family transcriptional regulator [Actinophytocola algeriensis]MBE1480978.1 AcrR family transcriptional regulator [Actinophytocola algeriensis]
MTSPSASSTGGLRERKKAKTKAAIQRHAVRLFTEQGFAATTVEQIAEAAEVSPSTVFRYFPTKEELVVFDPYDPVIFAEFQRQPPELSLVQAWRHALRGSFANMTEDEITGQLERGRLVLSVPELWGATLNDTRNSLEIMMNLSAERVGRSAEDPELRATVGAFFGVLLTAALDWVRTEDRLVLAKLDEALAFLDSGLLR